MDYATSQVMNQPMNQPARRRSVYFTEPYKVDIREACIEQPGPDQLLVETLVSGISAGTEKLVYQGRIPAGMAVDETIESLGDQAFSYPVKYGYSTVGRVIGIGQGVNPDWCGKIVFAFNPHESHFLSKPELLIPIDVSPEDALFLPNMETAVSFLMDSMPMIGEQVAVFGQGVVGLLTTMLLAEYPLGNLVTIDPYAIRRRRSIQLGADVSINPLAADGVETVLASLDGGNAFSGADLTYELSGNPQALQDALDVTGFDGRILLGSWYGDRHVELKLGGVFHRNQIKMISSQVSHLSPRWSGRWDKRRRIQSALSLIARHKPSSLITHRFPVEQAGKAYRLLDQAESDTIQVVLTY